jgi:pentafunctional AROM polypeptide
LHGEAIAIGLIKELELSHRLGLLDWNIVCRVRSLVNAFGLPTKLPSHLSSERILDVMKVDKKNRAGKKYVALMEGHIGKMFKNKAVPVQDDDISFVLAQSFLISHPPGNGACDNSHYVVNVPGSKSISNRALLMAAMGDKPCKLKNLLFSDDTSIMIQALCTLQVCFFSWDSNEDQDRICVLNVYPRTNVADEKLNVTIDCGNAGTAARFLTSFCCTINHVNSVTLTGNDRMKKRPIKPLVDALQRHGQRITYLEQEG